ncbi:GNAT family N-acetyltransferase [Persicitalea jodogahamensis]|uniref:N-acetyltransferase n=1 Tax=Persicitalea jodogahamensis TaxID=402147 RepID=A0A8J3G8Z0_9BACT|nr:GNAT family protein [Persicitalea jodogahamensis]GHB69175.1 N-acetyltransferase [Persicitalea jodogahamensis]
MPNWLNSIKLEGKKVDLVPLEKSHREGLMKAAADGELWNIWYTLIPTEETIDTYLENAFREQENGKSLPFAVVNKADGRIIGTTRYCNIDSANRRLEIGHTWYAKSVQRTGVNTECKYLLLRHAFESLHTIAVEFRTNWFNYRSRNAILRLGAKQDGVLRNHRIDQQGLLRDTVVFSIIQSEWKTVKMSLEFEMSKVRP